VNRTLVGVLVACLALGDSIPALSQDNGAYVDKNAIIHSDLPLWGRGQDTDGGSAKRPSQELWPQHFYSDDGSFGCSTAVSTGVWRYLELRSRSSGSDATLEPAGWYFFGNQGVYHCAATVANDYEENLDDARFGHGALALFVNLGEMEFDGRSRELWAIQMGFTPGSDYLLLARDPTEPGIIRRFDMLQRICPKANLRTGGSIDSFLTDYCAINTREDMIALAHSMAKLEPLGELKWAQDETAADD